MAGKVNKNLIIFASFIFANQISMKKFKFLLVVFSVLALASCKEDLPQEETTVSVLAALENGRVWNSGDEVFINGVRYIVENGGESTVTINEVAKAESYQAVYDCGNGSIEGNVLKLSLPSLQSPSASMAYPMVASNGAPNLLFKNVLGTVRMSISGTASVKKVVLTSFGAKISGDGTVSMNYTGNPELKMSADASNVVTVDLGTGVALPADVDVALPAALYEGFMVTIYDAEGGAMTGKEISSLEVKRGEVVSTEVAYAKDEAAPVYVTASVEKAADGSDYVWSAAYPLYVNGTPVQAVTGEGTSTAEFGPVKKADMYYASTSSASANGLSGTQMRTKISKDQPYQASLAVLNPAAGKSAGETLELKYLAGVVTVEVTGPHMIREVVLKAEGNRRLAGNGVVDMSSDAFRLSLNADASKEVRVDCGASGVDVTEGATFRFVIPADSYSDGFVVSMTDVAGQVSSQEVEGVTVKRNEVASLGSVEWVSTSGDNNNLSRLGYANSYMVHAAGTYSFNTRRVDNTIINDIAKVDWLWATKVEGAEGNALVSDITYADGEVTFTASDKEGNALLAAFDADGNILWSWHIWMTDMPETIDLENNVLYQSNGQTDGYHIMDRNLGATDATIGAGYPTFGLFYQWGRKDPFIGSTSGERKRNPDTGDWDVIYETLQEPITVTNSKYDQAVWTSALTTKETGSEEYAAAHPMHFMYCEENANQANWLAAGNFYKWVDRDDALWRPFQKTNSDPCPPGYKVPRNGTWNNLEFSYQFMEGKGIIFYNSKGESVWYPFAGFRSAHPSDQGAHIDVENLNGWLAVWSSELMVSERSYALKYNDPAVLPNSDASWGYGYNVRCVVDYN